MRAPSMTLILLGLLLPTPSLATDPLAARDPRIPISVSTSERNQTLFAMRESIHGLFHIHSALARGDHAAAALAANANSLLLERLPEGLRARLPVEFNQLGIGMNESFRALARELETRRDPAAMHGLLAESMAYCSGCHDTYRFVVRAAVAPKK